MARVRALLMATEGHLSLEEVSERLQISKGNASMSLRELLASRLLRAVVGDVVLTADEVVGLSSNLLVSRGPATGMTRFSDWLGVHADELGRAWANEIDRHFR